MTEFDKLFLSTQDPQNGVPACTTLLHKVCDGDEKKFDEACRLIELFVKKAQGQQ